MARDFISVMPTNLYGPGDNYHPEYSHVVAALIRRFHEAKVAGVPNVVVWGTGKPRREFLYVDDMAEACVHLMKTYSASEMVNIGTGEDIAIADFARVVAATVGYKGRSATTPRVPTARREAARRQPACEARLARAHLARGRHTAGVSGLLERAAAGGGISAVLCIVIARSEATKQSMSPQADRWIASLRSQ